jgi:redox-sensing transcriptional repressor
MPAARRIPEATVARLPLYLRALHEAARERTVTISSEALAVRAGVNAPQVRKDLSHLGSYGTRGVGYDVAYLLRQINRQLGLTEDRRVAIVGAGNLGRALASYRGFPARGFHVVAAFDVDPAKVGTHLGGVLVQPTGSMIEVFEDEKVAVAIIATPATAAQSVADAAVAAGAASILNFAPTTVTVPDHVALRQVDLGIELQILSFYEQQRARRLAAAAGQ